MKRNEAFDEVAQIYDEVRPSYPAQLIRDIVTKTELKPGSRLLEIGAGTGKATLQLARKGFSIQCVEPGKNLAAILSSKCSEYPGVKVDIAPFEAWEPREASGFDLICSAQAFHWVDPQLRYPKCHSLLRPGGHIALFWYQPSGEESELSERISSCITSYVPDYSRDEKLQDTFAETMEERKDEILSSGFFEDLQISAYARESSMNADTYMKVLNSYSKYAVIDESIKSELNRKIKDIINSSGGEVRSRLMFSLYIARRA